MKFFKVFLFIGAILCFSMPSYATKKVGYIEGEEVKKVQIKKKQKKMCGVNSEIKVAGFVTNPPFGWVTQEDNPRTKGQFIFVNHGYGYDLFKTMAKNLNYKIKNVGYKSYQDALKDLRRGRIDVVAGVYFSKYSLGDGVNLLYPSFMDNPVVPIFLKGKEKDVKSFADLAGLKGIVRQEEMIYPIIFHQLPKGVLLTISTTSPLTGCWNFSSEACSISLSPTVP